MLFRLFTLLVTFLLTSPSLAQISFTVTFNESGGALTAQERQDLRRIFLAAGADWARYMAPTGSPTIELELRTDNSTPRFAARSETTRFLGMVGGRELYEQGAAAEINTGEDQNGTSPDMTIFMNINYLRNELWFDPDPTSRTAAVPFDKTDAMSVALHELGHGWAYNGWSDGQGNPDPDIWSTFDRYKVNGNPGGRLPVFNGPQAVSAWGSQPDLTVDNINHWGNPAPSPRPDGDAPAPAPPHRAIEYVDGRPIPWCTCHGLGSVDRPDTSFAGSAPTTRDELMNGVAYFRGTRYYISALDRGTLRDSGVSMRDEPGEARLFVDGGGVADGGTFTFAGATAAGQTREVVCIIRNTGLGDLFVAGLTATGPFEVTQNFSGVVPVGAQRFARVRWTSTGATNDNGTLRFVNSDADRNPYNIALRGSTVIGPPEMRVFVNGLDVADGGLFNFGSDPNIAVNRPIIVRNIGTGPLWVGSETTTGPFEMVTSLLGTLPAGQQRFAVLRWTADGVGINSGTLRMINNDPDENPYNIDLRGTAVGPPEIRVFANGTPVESGAGINLGTAPAGATRSVFFLVRNTGAGPLVVSSVTLNTEDASLPEDTFRLLNDDPVVIPAGGNATYAARWTASGSGAREFGNLFIANLDDDESIYFLRLFGDSAAGAPEIRVFFNGSDTATDSTLVTSVPAGTAARTFPLIIRNTGTTPLSITNILTSGPYTLIGDATATIPPGGGQITRFVRYTVTDANLGGGRDVGAIRIENNDADENPFRIFFVGRVVAPSPRPIGPSIDSDPLGEDLAVVEPDDDATRYASETGPAPDMSPWPADGDTLPAGLRQLCWAEVNGATGYNLYLGTSTPLTDADFVGTFDEICTGDLMLEPDAAYVWRVDPILAEGGWIPRGPTQTVYTHSGPCLADFDRDGEITVSDVVGFMDAVATRSLRADVAPSKGTIDIDDLLAFIEAIEIGCD